MKTKRLFCILPVLAGIALSLSGCIITDTGYYGGPVVSTDFALSYGNGYRGHGYYYGPPNLGYYGHGPGIIYYESRAHVPRHHWQNYRGHHGDVPRGYH